MVIIFRIIIRQQRLKIYLGKARKMVKLFKKLFIKNYTDTSNDKVRYSYGLAAGLFGIISNTLMAIGKVVVGVLSGSIAIIGDAVNNMSDSASSLTTIVGFKIAAKPADKHHPYGHARFEYVTGLIISTVMIIVGITVGKSSIDKIISPVDIVITPITYIVLGLSILFKLFQMFIYMDFGKQIKSEALRAAGCDSRNDIITTAVVIISAVIISTTSINLDGYMGLAVAIFIIISSVMLLKDSINPLLGQKPDKELIVKIKTKLLSYEGVKGIHDLMLHDYGVNTWFAIVHVEVDSHEDMLKAHDMIDNIEKDFLQELGIHLVVHMDPIDNENDEVASCRNRCIDLLKLLDPTLTMHDFRMVPGHTHTNIIFDVVVPFESNQTKESIITFLSENFKGEKIPYFFVIDFDRP